MLHSSKVFGFFSCSQFFSTDFYFVMHEKTIQTKKILSPYNAGNLKEK